MSGTPGCGESDDHGKIYVGTERYVVRCFKHADSTYHTLAFERGPSRNIAPLWAAGTCRKQENLPGHLTGILTAGPPCAESAES